jgi:class 3 adenylate cyclase/predicted ATPase
MAKAGDIHSWLAEQGFAKYAELFASNEIDLDVLPELTDADLKDIGIIALGDRKRLLKAIASLEAAKLSSVVPTATSQPLTDAERRLITVLFCDLVGSTALASRLDAEDMRDILSAYHRCCVEQISTAGGVVAKYIGDGVLAYFGYPQAHEDDAEGAARAALALTEAVPKLRTEQGAVLQIRVGIATGVVVVGDLIGEGDAQGRGVVGDTPNVAARLQALAEPGQVVMADSTRCLTGGMFEYRDLGSVTLKGLSNPVRAWQVVGASAVQSRFEARHETSLTPLVGREEELELLLRRWQRAKCGEGRVVLLSGEPGIGKSRLTVALHERLQVEPHTRLRLFCSPHHQDSAFYPVIMQLERAAGFERHDAPEDKIDKLASLLGSSSGQEIDTQLLADLLSIPVGDRFAPLNWSPQRKKEKTLEALLRQLEMLSRRQPVIMVYEDVHWIDPSSRELLDMTVERVARLPVLLLITFRREFQAPWIDQAHVTTINLTHLSRRAGLALVGSVAANNALPEDIIEEIIDRTDGIPLFVEELTKAVMEAGSRAAKDAVSNSPRPAIAVPATLHASLMSRLDRLGVAAKEIAQIGAAIGREFSYELIAAVADRSDDLLRSALSQLVGSSLVFCRGSLPDATFLFKHALVQDAAYGTLLKSRRQHLHGRISQMLEERFPEQAANQPELLAHHYAEAGLAERAIEYWERAGERAAKRSANREAIAHLRKALQRVGNVSEPTKRADWELRLLVALGPALMATISMATPEVAGIYVRARQLAEQKGRSAELFPTVWGSWLSALGRGNLDAAGALVEELFKLALNENSPDFLLQAHHAAWPTAMAKGDLLSARRLVEEGIRLYRRKAHGYHALLYGGHDPGVCSHGFAACILCLLGYPDEAIRYADQALALAQELAHAPSLAHAYWLAGDRHHLGRDAPAARRLAEGTLLLAQAHDLNAVEIANATMLRGWALAAEGWIEDGSALMRSGLAAFRATGSKIFGCYRLARGAHALLIAEEAEEALALLDEAFRMMESFGERWYEAELHRLRGEALLLLRTDSQAGAEKCFQRALERAGEQGARLIELRAATSLARLWRDQGKRTEARVLLVPVYGWFTEGFDTPDLKEAKVLLEDLQ